MNEELTLLQQAMRIVEKHAPELFQVHSQKGRDFIHDMTKILELEKQMNNEPKSINAD
jgi:hypothetical protein